LVRSIQLIEQEEKMTLTSDQEIRANEALGGEPEGQ
jgi:hypothetical protein